MSKNLTLHPAMGPAIVRHLRQFGDLPAQGVLAGQAVASAIDDLWGPGGGVYNDVDVFRRVTPRWPALSLANTTAQRSDLCLRKEHDYDAWRYALYLRPTYRIQSVNRRGMLNFINCLVAGDQFVRGLTVATVLATFDLNAVRVGVDLASERLVWDAHYEAFLRSRQLKIVSMHTPWHSLLRLARKSEELPGVYANLEQAALASSALACCQQLQRLRKRQAVSLLFGNKLRTQADQVGSLWRPYFALESRIFSTQEDRGDPRDPRFHRWAEGARAEAARQTELWQLAPLGQVDTDLQQRIDRLSIGAVHLAPRVVEEWMRKKSHQVYIKRDALHAALAEHAPDKHYVKSCLTLLDTAYLKGQALPDVAAKVDAFVTAHPGFQTLLFGLTLAEQGDTIRRIQRVVSQLARELWEGESRPALGLLETQARQDDLLSEDRLESLLREWQAKQNQPFALAPLPLPPMPPEWSHFVVTELLTPHALKTEGQVMAHCVGGYAYKVEQNRCRILSLRDTLCAGRAGRSTAEIGLSGYSPGRSTRRFTLIQHQAHANTQPVAAHRAVMAYLLDFWQLTPEQQQSVMAGAIPALPPHESAFLHRAEAALQHSRTQLALRHERACTALSSATDAAERHRLTATLDRLERMAEHLGVRQRQLRERRSRRDLLQRLAAGATAPCGQ